MLHGLGLSEWPFSFLGLSFLLFKRDDDPSPGWLEFKHAHAFYKPEYSGQGRVLGLEGGVLRRNQKDDRPPEPLGAK